MTSAIEQIFEPPQTSTARRVRMRRRIALWTTAVVLAAVSGWTVWAKIIPSCGSLGSGVHRVAGECVGVTDGSYVFDPRLADIQRRIAEQNERVRATTSSYVQVAVLDLLTPTDISAKSLDNVRNELQGAYTAQRQHNELVGPNSSQPQVQLVLANWGSTEEPWERVADQLVELTTAQHPLVAVIGLGVSTTQTRQRAEDLSRHNIPMIGTLLTANELDHNHIPGFIRMSPTTRDYAEALRRYVDTRNELRSAVMVYDLNSDSAGDLFTKSLKDDLDRQMRHLIDENPPLGYAGASIPTPAGPRRFDLLTPNICAPPKDIVLFAGRRVDFDGFLRWLERRPCPDTPMTVITAADMGELLNTWEGRLRAAKLQVVYAGTSDFQGWRNGAEQTPEYYQEFLSTFTGYGFPESNLADGQAIQMHDALLTAANAVLMATLPGSSPNAGTILPVLLNLNGLNVVRGAGGTVSFVARQSGAGNPVGKPVPVLEFPSPPDDPYGRQAVSPPFVTR